MNTAYAYASGQNIGKQFEIIQAYSKKNQIKLLNQYFDSENDKTQNKFNKMIKDLFQFPPRYIIVCDENKISKDIEMVRQFKQHLSKYEVKLITIEEASRCIKNKEIEKVAVEKNLQNLEKVEFKMHKTHHHLFGYKAIKLKSGEYIWEIEEQSTVLLRKIALELYCELNYSYNDIKLWLDENGYKTARGKEWTISSVVNILNEDKLDVYAGKQGDISIFSKEEYRQIIHTKKSNAQNSVYGRTKSSTYLLTGLNLMSKPIFKCKYCSSNIVGYKNSSGKWSKYICGKYRNEGSSKCRNDWYIEQEKLETIVWDIIKTYYVNPEYLAKYKLEMNSLIKENGSNISKNSKLLIQNIIKGHVNIGQIVEVVEEAEWDEKRELVRIFLKTLVMDDERGEVYLDFYGCGEIVIKF